MPGRRPADRIKDFPMGPPVGSRLLPMWTPRALTVLALAEASLMGTCGR